MYLFITAIGLIMLVISAYRSRQIYHPDFALTGMIFVMFFSDFIVRGYDDIEIRHISSSDLILYQSVMLITIILSFMTYWIIFKSLIHRNVNFSPSKRAKAIAIVTAIALWVLEIYKRWSRSDYDVFRMVELTFGPRFGRPWSQSGAFGGDEFVASLIGIIFPLSGIIFGILLFTTRGILGRALLLAGWLAAIAISLGDGSRTIYAITIGIPIAIFISRSWPKNKLKTISMSMSAVTLIIIGFSIMYSTRDYGLISSKSELNTLIYHQDNSYYMALRAANIASNSNERWESDEFLTSSFLNFVPRAIWTGKPMLTQDFWGGYKPYYVTNSIFGEGFAMFGLIGGAIFAYVVLVLISMILRRYYRAVRSPIDLMAYLLICFYCYMIIRSFLNVSMSVYMPALAIFLLYVSSKMNYSKISKSSS